MLLERGTPTFCCWSLSQMSLSVALVAEAPGEGHRHGGKGTMKKTCQGVKSMPLSPLPMFGERDPLLTQGEQQA